MKCGIALVGLLVAVTARAQQSGWHEPQSYDAIHTAYELHPVPETRTQILAGDSSASYRLPLSRRSSVFGSIGLPGEPAFGPPASYTRHFPDMDRTSDLLLHDSVDYRGAISQVFTLGYRWRSVKVEGSAFSTRLEDERRIGADPPKPPKLASRSGRFSLGLAPNLSFQLSRGTLSNLDQLEPGGEVRRTTLSATYKHDLNGADWQTTLAWGRNARKQRESTYGYLLESSLRVANAHAFFGRMEQVGSDDILRENDSNPRQMFKMNKLTLGYVYDVRADRHMGVDVGALISRHYVPASMTATYGDDPVAYMMFVRFKFK